MPLRAAFWNSESVFTEALDVVENVRRLQVHATEVLRYLLINILNLF
jgi:hypothetical protein